MRLSVRPVIESGRLYAFPVVWTAVLAAGIGLREPLPDFDSSLLMSFNVIAPAAAQPSLTVPPAPPEPVLDRKSVV